MSSKQLHLKDQRLGRCIWLTALIAIIAFIGILVTIDYLPDHGMPDPEPIPTVTPSPTPHELPKDKNIKSTV
jgi:hypothetical protein